MSSIMFIRLGQFYTEVLERASANALTYRVVHRDGKVLDLCLNAYDKGLRPGSTLSEARAVLREDCTFTDYVQSDFVQARNEWLDRLLVYCDHLETPLPHEAFVDLSNHPQAIDVCYRIVQDIHQYFPEYSVEVGLAPAKWIASTVAQHVSNEPLGLGLLDVRPVTDVRAFLDGLPTMMLSPIDLCHREKLEFLGYRWSRDVASARLVSLMDQFGKDAFLIQECANGRSLDGVVPNYPSSSLALRKSFGHGQESSLAIEQAVKELCQELASQLCAQDLSAEHMTLYFERETGSSIVMKRTFPRPVQAATLLNVSATVLWRKENLTFAPTGIRILLSGLRSAPRGQCSFRGYESAYEKSRSCETAIKCLRAAFGDGVVVPAKDLTVPRRQSVLRAWKRATGWR